MDLTKSRHEEMTEQVRVYHKENPGVWKLFCLFTQQLIDRGFVNYSANAVFERIRWQSDVASSNGGSTFRINNNYRAFYARAWMKLNPDYDGFFRTREQTSKQESATGLSELTPTNFP